MRQYGVRRVLALTWSFSTSRRAQSFLRLSSCACASRSAPLASSRACSASCTPASAKRHTPDKEQRLLCWLIGGLSADIPKAHSSTVVILLGNAGPSSLRA